LVSQEEVRKRAKIKNEQRRARVAQDALAETAERQNEYAG
jgi:hypothetical protein